jgi:transposase-like protein
MLYALEEIRIMDQRLQFLSSYQKEEMSVADLCRAHGISRPTAYRWIDRYNDIDTAGVRTTAASGIFKDLVPTEDAEVVRRLKQAGAVTLGELNLHEFAYGGTSDVSYFGPVHNPGHWTT